MARLIDADALLKDSDKREGAYGWIFSAEDIRNAPTIEAEPVKHGKWELHGNDDDTGSSYFCSNCGSSYDEDWFYVHGEYAEWKNCPNCRARMRGE